MNRCETYIDNLSAYLDREISEADKKSFEDHIGECEVCANETMLMQTIISTCNELEEDLPDGFEASLHQRLEAAKKESEVKKNKLVKIRLFSQIAAGFILVTTLGLLVRSGLFSPYITKNDTASGMAGSTAAPSAPSEDARSGIMAMKSAASATATEPTVMADGGTQKIDESLNKVEDQSFFTMSIITAAPEAGAGTGEGEADKAENPEAIALHMAEPTVVFTEDAALLQDTLVKVRTEDINKAIFTVMAINEKMGDTAQTNRENLKNAKETFTSAAEQSVELKIIYSNDDLWQEFLDEMQGVFPEMKVESVPASEEQGYIRVVIEKE